MSEHFYPPRWMRRPEAARCVGVSPLKFDRASAQNTDETAVFPDAQVRRGSSFCADDKFEEPKHDEHLRECADAQGVHRQEDDNLDIPEFLRRVA
jgi:hypothetical protein